MKCGGRPDAGRGVSVLVTLAVAAGGCSPDPAERPPSAAAGADPRPNLVFMISDDQDWQEFGFMGTPQVRTPEIDRIAREGVVFPEAHVPMSRCRPVLASFLDGRWPHQSGLYYNYGEPNLDPVNALPARLRDAGYVTFVGGKFWEGDPEAYGFTHGAEQKTAGSFVRRGQGAAFRFIDDFAGKTPMFLWWAPKIPHTPHNPPEEYLKPIREDDLSVLPWIPPDRAAEFREQDRLLYAMEAWLDDAVGDLRDHLQERGALENTLLVFLVDNGWSNGYPSKGTAFEAGVKTPLIFRWPERFRPAWRAETLLSTNDVYPTLLDFAGAAAPDDMAGTSLRAALESGAPAGTTRLFGAIYPAFQSEDTPGAARDLYALYLRDGRWKYILYLGDVSAEDQVDRFRILSVGADYPERAAGAQDLYDLDVDPVERNNLADRPDQQERLAEMRAAVLDWWTSTGGGDLSERLSAVGR